MTATFEAFLAAAAIAFFGAASSEAAERAGNGFMHVEARMRAEPGARRVLSPWDGGSAFAPLSQGEDGPTPAHLRLNGDYGAASAAAR